MEDLREQKEDSERFDVILEDVETGIRPRKIKETREQVRESGGGWQYAAIAGEIGFDIALPMVLGLVIGTKLDEVWDTRPRITLILFFVGLMMSCASLIRIVRDASHKR